MMAVDQFQLSATIGADGTATISSERGYFGAILAVHLNYTSAGATSDVTLTCGSPAQTILVRSNSETDGWFYPVVQFSDAAAAAIAGQYGAIPLNGEITMAIAGGTEAGTVTATIIYIVPGK